MTAPRVDAPTDTAAVADLVRAAVATRSGVRIRGAGTWLAAGEPVRAASELSLSGMRGIVRYTPDDLTMTVDAGTTLAELDDATRRHGQWCPLLPWGDDRGTVGATIATATTGPFASALGRPRDLVLGMDAVDGNGRVISAGGRVVKNVAGFDLTRAFTGSWGTLAVITRLHLRLRARPVVDETWALELHHGSLAHDEPNVALWDFMRGPLAPLACEALMSDEASALGIPTAGWLVRLGGSASLVAAARQALARLGAVSAQESIAWDRLRARRSPAPRTGRWRWDSLSRRLKSAFDPSGVLNPGLLGEAA